MHGWTEIPTPPRKADWRFKYLKLLALPPEQNLKGSDGRRSLPLEVGAIVKIEMRRKASDTWAMPSRPDVSKWGDLRVLEVIWCCGYCGSSHSFFVPETWVAEGKAVFVAQENCDETF